MSNNSGPTDGPLRRAEVLSLAPYEKRFISAAFLAQVTSGLVVVFLVGALGFLLTGNDLIALELAGSLTLFVLWSCAIAYMWRAVIFILALLFFLDLIAGALVMSNLYLQQQHLLVGDDTLPLVVITLGIGILPILFACTVLLDGYRLARTRSEMRELYATIDRHSHGIPQMHAGARLGPRSHRA